jgi:hypothetical protein
VQQQLKLQLHLVVVLAALPLVILQQQLKVTLQHKLTQTDKKKEILQD